MQKIFCLVKFEIRRTRRGWGARESEWLKVNKIKHQMSLAKKSSINIVFLHEREKLYMVQWHLQGFVLGIRSTPVRLCIILSPIRNSKEPAAPLLLASTLLQLPVPDLGRAAVKRTSAERIFFYLPLPPLAQSPSHSPILMFLQLTFFPTCNPSSGIRRTRV